MLDVFPLTDVIRKVLTGSGECAKVTWTFLGLSMPGLGAIAAAGSASLGLTPTSARGAAAASAGPQPSRRRSTCR